MSPASGFLRKRFLPFAAVISASVAALHAGNEGARYRVLDLGDLDFAEDRSGELRDVLEIRLRRNRNTALHHVTFPTLRFPGAPSTRAFVVYPPPEGADNGRRNRWSLPQRSLRVWVRAADPLPITGRALLRTGRGNDASRRSFTFTLSAQSGEPNDANAFAEARRAHYARLAGAPLPGAAWFRYLAGDAATTGERTVPGDTSDFDRTFALFSGNRAVAENIALDRRLILGSSGNNGDATVPIDSIEGVTVTPIDWSERIDADEPADTDLLANAIPHDQHAVFFGSMEDLQTLRAVIENEGVPVIGLADNAHAYGGLPERYLAQMGIGSAGFPAHRLPIGRVALTGGDPFFPSGTDLALLFETADPEGLFTALSGIVAEAAEEADATSRHIDIDGNRVAAHANPDRSFSAFLYRGPSWVALANSPAQIRHLNAVRNGHKPALGGTDEFRFFRQRYKRSGDETAFVFLSDATIRRWAGPRVRIGASRRARAAAVLADAAAARLAGESDDAEDRPLVGKLRTNGESLRSPTYNTLRFLTPLSELDLREVTVREKEAYTRWRRGYESGWATVFDPIALRLHVDQGHRKADLSVIPLAVGSDYADWVELTGDAYLDAPALDPHPEALLFFSFAVDTDSELFDSAAGWGQSIIPALKTNPLAWMAGSVTVFLDNSDFWRELAKANDASAFMRRNLPRLPLGLRIASKDPARLAVFLTTLRGFAQQAAPGLLQWTTREHNGQSYVVVRPAPGGGGPPFAVRYAAMRDALLISPNETALHGAIERAQTAEKSSSSVDDADSPEANTPKRNIYGMADLRFWARPGLWRDSGALAQQRARAWSAIPILNEWHRRFPDKDPVRLHRDRFHETPVCPAGKGYRWNAELRTVESVAFGSPESPGSPDSLLPLAEAWEKGEASVEFEDDGLRARAELSGAR